MNNWKKTFEAARRRVDAVLGHPMIEQVSSVGEDMLDIAVKLAEGGKNPLSIGSATASFVGALQRANIIRSTSAITLYREKHELDTHLGINLYTLMMENDVLNESESIKVASDTIEELWSHSISEGSEIYATGYYNRDSSSGNDVESNFMTFLTSKNFDKNKLAERIWAKFPTGLYLQVSGEENELILNKVVQSADNYVPPFDIGEFVDSLRVFKQEGISRSYLLLGPPGVGKSSFTNRIGRHFGNRFIKIDPSVMLRLSASSLSIIFDFFKPEVVVMDDFDRAESEKFLFLLENMKNTFPQITLFGTVNYVAMLDAALIRPGRFDEPIWFEYPDEQMRAVVLRAYLEKFQIVPTEMQLKHLVSITENLSQAHLKEITIKIRQKGMSCADDVVETFHRLAAEHEGE